MTVGPSSVPSSDKAKHEASMPPGMVMGSDGKPCKVCTAFRNWKPKIAKGSETDSSGDHRTTDARTPSPSTQDDAIIAPRSTVLDSRSQEPPPGCPPDSEQLGRATWTFLHATAAYYPDKPSPTQRANMIMLLRSLPVLYPCGWCATDFGMDMERNPPNVSSRSSLSRWLCERHNAVNTKLGKEIFDCSKVDMRWRDGAADDTTNTVAMAPLPILSEIQNCPSSPQSPLAAALNVLFEHSAILSTKLEPQLHDILRAAPALESYTELIHVGLSEIQKWDWTSQAEFIAGHPRIGETQNLSKLSASEQGSQSTPPDVLARLAHLNELYEAKYPGLRYITFVNGRSRAEIVAEMEEMLGTPHSLSAEKPEVGTIIEAGNEEWKDELGRAVVEVGLIATSRLRKLGVE